MKRNTIYYKVRSEYKDSDKIIENVNSKDFIYSIDKISRSLLELGINNKNEILIIGELNFKLIKTIYALSKIGIGLIWVKKDEICNINLEDYKYLFIDDLCDFEESLDNFNKVIVFGDCSLRDDIIISWDEFYSYSSYYNKEVINYDNFYIKYYEYRSLVKINDKDIIDSLVSFDGRFDKNSIVDIVDGNITLITYLILNNNKIYFGNNNSNILYISDDKLISNYKEFSSYKKIYSSFNFINEYQYSNISDLLGNRYVRYFSYYNKLISIGNEFSIIDESLKVEDISSKKVCKDSEYGDILIKVNNKYVSTNLVGCKVDNKLNIVDYKDRELERISLRKTGYPNIDKPWLKYYSKESLNDKVLEYTLYQNLKEMNKDNYLGVALEYMGNEIKYYEMFNEIEKLSKSLYALGVRKGDYVTFCLPNIPEFVYLFYAVNKIGAVASLIEPRTTATRILDYLNESKSKVMIIVDLCKNNIDKIIDKSSINTVVSLSPMESVTDKKIKRMYNLTHKKYKYSGKYISYKEFKCIGESVLSFKDNEYKKDDVVAVVYTSGTTGKPKGAMLTNESFNGQNMQLKYSGICPNVGERFLGNIPFFTAYGASVGMHNALSYGVKIALVPAYKPKDFPKLIKKYKPNHAIGTPRFFEIMSESNVLKNDDLSYLRTSIFGGDKMTPNKEYKVNEFMINHNTDVIKKGLGMSEYGGGFCTTVNKFVNKIGSVGIPHVGNNIKIIDKNGNEVTYGREHKVGELYVTGPTQMKGYLANEEENEKFFCYDEDGVRWSKTGDLVYMDEDGVLFFAERIKNIVIRPDGHKVPILPLENIVDKCDYVDDCSVVGVGYKEDNTGKYPMLFISLKDDINVSKEVIHKEIVSLIEKNIPDRDRPEWYRYVKKIPYTLAGKKDVVKLSNIGKNNQNKKVLFEDDKK